MRSQGDRQRKAISLRDARQADAVDLRVAERIKTIRRARSVTREQLAGLIGVSLQQLVKYEQGTNRISASRMLDLANALDVDITEFFSSDAIATPSADPPLAEKESELLAAFRRISSQETQELIVRMVRLVANGDSQVEVSATDAPAPDWM